MTVRRSRGGSGQALPVDPERLRREFPDLDEDDLNAYVQVTRRILGDRESREGTTRELMDRARAAERKRAAGQPLSADEELVLRYRRAVGKMQKSTVRQ